jgi:acetyl-CoA acyltransferase 2
MSEIYILGGARTPFGSFGGALKYVEPTSLGVTAGKEAIKRSDLESAEIDMTVVGNVIHVTSNAAYLGRHIALGSGVPISSPALTVNRLCGSGLQAVITLCQSIRLGESEAGLAVGTENMSMAPFMLRGNRFGTGMDAPVLDDMLRAALVDEYCGTSMGMTAENLAVRYNITRAEQDQFALESHLRAASARREGRLAEEIVSVEIQTKKGTTLVEQDEHIRENTTIEALSKLSPSFKKNGTVTAGNASGINDGAGAIVLASKGFVKKKGTKPVARVVSWGVAGVPPEIMGIGPVPAIQMALKRANLSIQNTDLFEINEAFASQYLAVEKELGLDRSITNVNGGAIAFGHPIGGSGVRILYSLILELKRRQKKYGVASLCIGGGQGIAVVVEVF